MKIALAMICKGSDTEAVLLDRCLDNMHSYVDDIFISASHLPNEKPNRKVVQVAMKYKAHLSHFEWQYDFSAARNFNFSQVPKEYDYIIWSDTDDVWRGLDKLKKVINDNKDIDGFGFQYLYDWDEFKRPIVVHRKTMIVKNNGCVVWKGRVHEDLTETREVKIKLVDGIDRLHLTDEKRSNESAKRNLDIAEKTVIDSPEDPRTQWNLANAQLMMSEHDKAIESFELFLTKSLSDDERYLAYQRLSDVYRRKGDAQKAINNLHLAVGMKPELPDAYFALAHLYFSIGNMDKAEYYSIYGLQRRPQPHKMIVFNPRDYDYNPMMLLAKIYANKNRPDLMLPLLEGCSKIYPKDKSLKKIVIQGRNAKKKLGAALEIAHKLKKIKSDKTLKIRLEALPKSIQSHPAICAIRNTRVIKTESSGKDLVYYCGDTAQRWNGKTYKTEMVGGSEEAVINLSREWAKMGWNVTVYNNCGHQEVKDDIGGVYIDNDHVVRRINGSVTYKPFWQFNPRDKQDVVIIWRNPKVLDIPINATNMFVDLHDVIQAGEFTPERISKLTKVFVKTKFHRSLYPNLPDDKIQIVPNGMIVYEHDVLKDNNLIINTSSPDRSLTACIDIFKKIKKQIPTAKMKWAYGWSGFELASSNNPRMQEWMQKTIKEAKEAGIESLGRLPQDKVGELYQEGAVFLYPTEFAEIDCISVKKAQAAGCFPVTTDFAALDESNQLGVKVHSEKTKDNWCQPYQFDFSVTDEDIKDRIVAHVISVMKNKTILDGDAFAQKFAWEFIAKKWIHE